VTAAAGSAPVRVALGICVRPLGGESVSGDACVEVPWSRGVIVALADGLGHGERAAVAANAFVACVAAGAELALEEMFARGHRALLKTRGAVATVARFDEARGQVEIAAIGNVAAQLARGGGRRSEHTIAMPGVLGSAYRAVRPQVFSFEVGDLLLVCSDGVRARFDLDLVRALDVKAAAESIVRTNGKGTDDAACAVARGVSEMGFTRRSPAPERALEEGERVVPIRIRGDAECAAHEARAFAKRAGLGARAEWEVSIAASELATNMLKFAGEGEVRLRHVRVPREAIVVEAVDRGHGIANVSLAIADGFSGRPEAGLGVGLGSVHRLMDHVDIQSDMRTGTRIVASKFRT
jgi:negative regulator of sigma-B (phosphoserine phosphatase)